MFRRFFNDRRFNFNGPQRIRDNVTSLLNDINHHLAHENPELLAQVTDQLNRLNDMLSGRPPTAAAVAPNIDQTAANSVQTSDASTLTTSIVVPPQPNDDVSSSSAPTEDQTPWRESVVLNMEEETQTPSANATITESEPTRHSDQSSDVANTTTPDSATLNNSSAQSETGAVATATATTDPIATAVAPSEANSAASSAGSDWRSFREAMRRPEMQVFLKAGLFFVPFLLMLAGRTLLTYPLDAFVITLWTVSFLLHSQFVVRLAGQAICDQRLKLVAIISYLSVELLILYDVLYKEDNVDNLLWFSKPRTLIEVGASQLCLFTVVWYTFISDLAAKILTLIAKTFLILVPDWVIALRRKRVCYQWIELTSQMYRWCLPIVPWCVYLQMSMYYLAMFNNVIGFFYAVLKAIFLITKIGSWWACTKCLVRPVLYGATPDETDLQKSGSACPICFEAFNNASKLQCNHVFCEECIATWLDKESTCPVCRTQIGSEDKVWRDGATSMGLVLF